MEENGQSGKKWHNIAELAKLASSGKRRKIYYFKKYSVELHTILENYEN